MTGASGASVVLADQTLQQSRLTGPRPPLGCFMLAHGALLAFHGAPCKTGWGGSEHLADVAESVSWDYREVLAQQSETAELQLFHICFTLKSSLSLNSWGWIAGESVSGASLAFPSKCVESGPC